MHKLNYYFFVALFIPVSLFAWGKVGHQATAIIAEKNLSPKAIKEITALIGSTDLRESSLWPDKIKSEASWFHSKPYHFTSVDDGQSYYDSLKNQTPEEIAEGDALRALVKSEDVLRSLKSSKEEKINALKFLVHLISDIHQPLHTGRPQDKGGNLIKFDWLGENTTLHAVWDYEIIDSVLGLNIEQKLPEESSDYVKLVKAPSSKQATAWTKGSYLDWHNESLAFRSLAYEVASMQNSMALSKTKLIIEDQINKSGFRLAHVLNSIFGNIAINKEGLALRSQLNKILGSKHLNQLSIVPMSRELRKDRSDFFHYSFHRKYDCPHEH